jgi:ElaA protein
LSRSDVVWQVERFETLSLETLYAVLAARVEVFVVEQDCPYQDLDGQDRLALHVIGSTRPATIAAYARLLPPDNRFAEPSIGRVLTAGAFRRSGLGIELMQRSIRACSKAWPGQPLRISAQRYLERFYGDLGFRTASEPYLEDGIPHVEMVRSADSEQ